MHSAHHTFDTIFFPATKIVSGIQTSTIFDEICDKRITCTCNIYVPPNRKFYLAVVIKGDAQYLSGKKNICEIN